jgi:hypothetical protein
VLSLTGCWDANPIVLCDLDDDGKMDLVVGGSPGKDSRKEITIYLNRTADAGGYLKVLPRMAAPNPFAVGAVVEVFAAGDLGQEAARPLLVEKAHPDGTPVHVGLAGAQTCDLRVTFPNGRVATQRGVRANTRVTVPAPTEGSR